MNQLQKLLEAKKAEEAQQNKLQQKLETSPTQSPIQESIQPPIQESIQESIKQEKSKNPTAKASLAQTLEQTKQSGFSLSSAMAGLSKTLEGKPEINNTNNPNNTNNTNNPIPNKPKQETQFTNPTLEDVSNFVFEEQPTQTNEQIVTRFQELLSELESSLGDQVPRNLTTCMEFMESHPFLADILKPEAITPLVRALSKSYGYIVTIKNEKDAKKQKQNEEINQISDLLGDAFSL